MVGKGGGWNAPRPAYAKEDLLALAHGRLKLRQRGQRCLRIASLR